MSEHTKWTPEMQARLVEMWPTHMVHQIATALGVSLHTICRRRKRAGLPKNTACKSPDWTADEIATLREMLGQYSADVIAAKLGRTRNAVNGQRSKLKLPRVYRGQVYQPSKAQWIAAATRAAEAAKIPPVKIMAGARLAPIAHARWIAWRSLLDQHPHLSIAGVARISGFHHTSVMNGLRRLGQIEGGR